MNILAIDIGTQTGWARSSRAGTVHSGSENFAPRRMEAAGQRWLKFRAFLNEQRLQAGGEIHAIYFEDVKNHAGVLAAHVYGGFLACLEMWCAANNVPLRPVGVGTVKRHWTGKGNADKAAMCETARAKGFQPKDNNEADALAILSLARHIEGAPAPAQHLEQEAA
jgi:Holliday junction resolvasome RuvABC endonuclease subunit